MAKKKGYKTRADLAKENEHLRQQAEKQITNSRLWRYRASIYNENYGYNRNADMNGNSSDASILQKLDELRKISLESYANMPIARAVINNIVAHTILDGIHFTVDTEDHKFNDAMQTKLNRWAASTDCDASGNHCLNELIECSLRTMLLFGEEYATFVTSEENPKSIQSKLRLIHPDRVRNPTTNKTNLKKDIVGGVELNRYGKEVAIFVSKKDGKYSRWALTDKEGNKLGTHLYRKEFIDQHHGVPALTTVYPLMLDLMTFIKSEVRAAANSSAINLMFHTENPAARTAGLWDQEGVDPTQLDATEIQLPIINADAGQMIPLLPHESISQLRLERPTGTFSPFVLEIVKEICASMGFAYEYLFMSFADSNYSSARLSALTSQKELRRLQILLTTRLIEPLLSAVVAEILGKNMVKMPDGYSLIDVLESINVVWTPFPLLDPGKEVDWMIKAMSANLMTLEDAAMKLNGKEYEAILTQVAREDRERINLGLPPMNEPKGNPGKPPGEDSTRS